MTARVLSPTVDYAAWKQRTRRANEQLVRWVQQDPVGAQRAAHDVHLDVDGLVLCGGGVERAGRGPEGRDSHGVHFLVPFQDAIGRVAGAKFRCLNGYRRGTRTLKSVSPSSAGPWPAAPGLFGLSQLPLAYLEGSTIVLCEGESDYTHTIAALVRENRSDVVAIGLSIGVGQSIEPWAPLLWDRDVIVAVDHDENGAGRRGAARLVLQLLKYVDEIRVALPPPTRDLRDLLDAGRTVSEFLDAARQFRPMTVKDRHRLENVT